MQDEGVNNTQMHVLSNVSIATLSNWFTGPTRRPSHAALAAAFAAIGYDYVPQKRRMLNLEDELPKAQRWMERYKAEQQKGK
jgi:hypothetical protein